MNIPVQPPGKNSLSLSALLNIASALDKTDANNYEAVLDRYMTAIKPRDVFEEKFATDFADSSWEKYKLLCRKEELAKVSLYDALADILRPLVDDPIMESPFFPKSKSLARDFYLGNSQAIQQVNDLLAKAGMTMKNVKASAYAKNLEAMRYFDIAIASAESRWNSSKRELDRHRDRRRLQELPPAEDADFEVVSTKDSRVTVHD